MGFAKRDEDDPSLILEARKRLLLQSGASRSPSRAPYFRARGERFHVYMYIFIYMYACTRAHFTRSYADDSVAKRAGQHTAGAPSWARRDGGGGGGGEERIEEANSTGQAVGSSAGPALGPTGEPGVTFQDGCA